TENMQAWLVLRKPKDEEEVSSDDNEMVEVKVLMTLADDESGVVGKESSKNDEWVKISMRKVHTLVEMEDNDERKYFLDYLSDDTNVSIPNVERPWFYQAEGLMLPNHDTVCITPLPLLEKLTCDETQTEPSSGPKTLKSILKACSSRKAKISKDVVINETKNSSTPSKGIKNGSASKRNSAPVGKLKNVKTEDYIPMSMYLKTQGESSSRSQSFKPLKPFPPCKHCRFNDHQSDDCHNYPICELYGSFDHDTKGHNKIISLRRGIKPRNPQYVTNSCETCGSTVHTTTDHNDMITMTLSGLEEMKHFKQRMLNH
ncbi:hypothetical protein Tco_1010365, partial [Tanacetum coccineum]